MKFRLRTLLLVVTLLAPAFAFLAAGGRVDVHLSSNCSWVYLVLGNRMLLDATGGQFRGGAYFDLWIFERHVASLG